MTRQHRRAAKKDILRYGQHIVCVIPNEFDPPGSWEFMYTIGMTELGLPELLTVWHVYPFRVEVLNLIADMQKNRGKSFEDGEVLRFQYRDTRPVTAMICDAGEEGKDQFAIQVGEYYRSPDYKVMQVLFADQNGHYPGDPNCTLPKLEFKRINMPSVLLHS